MKKLELMIKKAKIDQKKLQYNYDQKKIINCYKSIALSLINNKTNLKYSTIAVKETGFGSIQDKIIKNYRKTFGLLTDLENTITFGINKKKDINSQYEFIKPVGVLVCFVPSTNPIATLLNYVINSIATRNSVIISPSPKSFELTKKIIKKIRLILNKHNLPKNIVQTLDIKPNFKIRDFLLNNCDKSIITGNKSNILAGKRSNKISLGVGVGNVVSIVCKDININPTVDKIIKSVTFDNGTSCSSENFIFFSKLKYYQIVKNIEKKGGYFLDDLEKEKLLNSHWNKNELNIGSIGKSAEDILNLAGIKKRTKSIVKFLLIKSKYKDKNKKIIGEKLSPIVSYYFTDDLDKIIDFTNYIYNFAGEGHSIGIHTHNKTNILKVLSKINTSRLIINQSHCFATGGSFENTLPFSLSMSCGSWQNNYSNNNLNWKDYCNITTISNKITNYENEFQNIFKGIKIYD